MKNKKIFTNDFTDMLSDFLYKCIKNKGNKKSIIKNGINAFEHLWIFSMRKNQK